MGLAIWWLGILKACLLPALAISIFVTIYYIDLAITNKKAKKARRAKIEYAKMVA